MIAFLILLSCGQDWTPGVAPPLLEWQRSRRAIEKAEIHWSLERSRLPGDSTAEFVSRIAGREWILDGPGAQPAASAPAKRGRERYLMKNGEFWDYIDGIPIVDVRLDTEQPVSADVLTIGAAPTPIFTGFPFGEPARAGVPVLADPEHRIRHAGHETIVEMRDRQNPEEVLRWTLDTRLDGQPVRVELLVEGLERRTAHIEYERYGPSQFFPKSAVYAGPDGNVTARLTVSEAHINDDAMPGSFSPEDIGVGNGMEVHYSSTHPQYGRPFNFVDGAVVPQEEYFHLAQALGVRPCPLLAKEVPALVDQFYQARLKIPRMAGPLTHPLGLWEEYTRDFIQRYRLDDAQRQKAMAILTECQDHAAAQIRRIAPVWLKLHDPENGRQLAELEQEINAAAESQPAPPAPRGASEPLAEPQSSTSAPSRPTSAPADPSFIRCDLPDPAAATRCRELQAPVYAIFDNELKPRLERLLTRAQRRAGEARP